MDHYGDLDAGTRAATVVVVARVVDVVVTRIFQGEIADDRFPMIGLVLRPTDVVAGTLPPEFGDRVTVEFVGATGSDEEEVAKLKRRLPAQPGLWFLHLKGEGLPEERGFFRPISPQGLFVQGNQGVETPLTTEGDGDMAAEGRTYPPAQRAGPAGPWRAVDLDEGSVAGGDQSARGRRRSADAGRRRAAWAS